MLRSLVRFQLAPPLFDCRTSRATAGRAGTPIWHTGPVLRSARAVLAAAMIGSMAAIVPAAVADAGTLVRPMVGIAATPDGKGYWEVASDGGVFSFGDAGFFGSAGGRHLNAPVVGLAATPDGKGYWEVASDGGIFTYGDAGFFGSAGSLALNRPVVGMATTPDGKGYWEVASDGGIFGYGDAGFFGSAGSLALNRPVVGMAATPDGKGYWLAASDGGIFGYGDAGFFGSAGSLALSQPVVGMAAAPGGKGYWLAASDGGIFGYGDAGFFGSAGSLVLNRPVVGMAAAPDARGYWLAASDGGIFGYGDAGFFGSAPGLAPPGPRRVALYGDSLGMEAGMDFTYLGRAAGASVLVRTYGGLAVCDLFGSMASDAAAWQPTDVVLEFSGDNFTPCMAGDPIGSPQYYAKYRADLQQAIDIFRPNGTRIFLSGIPYNAWTEANTNIANLNQLFASVAMANSGVTYVDAGQAVMANGAYTQTLPCLAGEPCTGPSGTNVVRAPDGVHFCPTGNTTAQGYFELCDVYSSGAFRYAAAMLRPALDP